MYVILQLCKKANTACAIAEGIELQHALAAHRLDDRTWQCSIWCEDLRHSQTDPLNIVISDHLASKPLLVRGHVFRSAATSPRHQAPSLPC